MISSVYVGGGHIGRRGMGGWMVSGRNKQYMMRRLTKEYITCVMHKSTMTFIIEWKWRRRKMHDAICVTVAFVDRFLRIVMEIHRKFLQEAQLGHKKSSLLILNWDLNLI